MVKWQKAKLTNSEKLTEKIKSLIFSVSNWKEYKAGQYYDIRLDEKSAHRSFSIVSSPKEKGGLEFAIELLKGGEVSPQLFNLKLDDEVEISGPKGNFYCDFKKPHNLLLIAGGSGVTPFISVLRDLNNTKLSKKIILLVSVGLSEDIPYLKELEDYSKNFNNFKFIKIITKSNSKRIDHVLLNTILQEFSNLKIFISGSTSFVENIYSILNKLGVKQTDIYRERFGPFLQN